MMAATRLRVAQPRNLSPQCSPEDAGAPACAAVHMVGQVDDDPSSTSSGAWDGTQTRRRSRVAHRAHSRTGALPGGGRLSSREPFPMGLIVLADGTVIIIGGAEDKVRDRVILSRFVALAGGEDATIAVVSTASSLGLEAGERYRGGLRRARRQAGPAAPRGDPAAGQRRVGRADGPGRDRRLPDRRQPAATVVDDRRDSPGGRDPRAVPARRGRRRHLGRRVCDVEPHDRVRRVGRDAEAPDGPDRGRPRRPARRDRRPAFPAAEPARPAAQPDRPEPEPARARRRRGHGRRRRPGPRHGGDRARLDHGRRRLRLRDRRLGGPRPSAADDQRRRAPLAAGRLSIRPSTPARASRRPPCTHSRAARPLPAERAGCGPPGEEESRGRHDGPHHHRDPLAASRAPFRGRVPAPHRPCGSSRRASCAARTTGPASRSSACSSTSASSRSSRRTRSRASTTRWSRCCRRSRTTPARSAGAAGSSPGCATGRGPATSPSTSRSSSRTSPAPTSATARPARRVRRASTTASTSTARRRSASRPGGWRSRSSTTSSRPTIRTSSSTSPPSSRTSSGSPSGRRSGRRPRRSSTRRSAATSRSSGSTATRWSSSATASTSSGSGRR